MEPGEESPETSPRGKVSVQSAMDSPYKTAMDITRDNRAFVSKGDEIRLHTPTDGGKFTQAYRARLKDDTTFSPRKISMHDQSRKMLMLTPDKKNMVVFTDTETGKALSQFSLDLMKDVASPIATFVHDKKFGRLSQADTVKLKVATGHQLVDVEFDPRVKESEQAAVIQNLDDDKKSLTRTELPKKAGAIRDVATTSEGGIVAASADGVVRLYSELGKKKATTELNQYSGVPILGVDVSSDGHWVLYTTAKYLGLVNVAFKSDKGVHTTGFDTTMGKHKKPVMLIRLSDKDLADMGISEDEVSFGPARFDNGPSLDVSGTIVEKYVVTSTGNFTVQWNMRHLESDYAHVEKAEADFLQKAKAQIYRQSDRVLNQLFDFDSSYAVVTAMESDFKRIKI
eukprot:TRINITY_DN23967_c0_g1_i1.p1 TRINITY_DN23967_c0_g1~~TRINITY_DN23967_c0_g1_i1.p1  ORF type:complete len:446 (+),score=186.74 TRINITY_DN23967_c0_g1_i1:145-1338(+)